MSDMTETHASTKAIERIRTRISLTEANERLGGSVTCACTGKRGNWRMGLGAGELTNPDCLPKQLPSCPRCCVLIDEALESRHD